MPDPRETAETAETVETAETGDCDAIGVTVGYRVTVGWRNRRFVPQNAKEPDSTPLKEHQARCDCAKTWVSMLVAHRTPKATYAAAFVGTLLVALGLLAAPGAPSRTARDVSAVNGGFLPPESIDGNITAAPMAMWADQEFWSWTRGDFNVFAIGNGHHDELFYIVRGSMFSFHSRMTIFDPLGKKVAVVQKHIMSLHAEYQIYRYWPNQPGQTSSDTDDDGVPIFRWARVQKAAFAWTSEFYYNLYVGNDIPSGKTSELLAKGQMSWEGMTQAMMDIKRPGSAQPILGTVGRSSMFHLRGNVNWVIEVGRGMDALGMLCLTLAAHQIHEAEEDARQSSHRSSRSGYHSSSVHIG